MAYYPPVVQTSAQLAAQLSDETGSGANVFANSPAITTPTGIVKGDVGLGSVTNDAQTKAAIVPNTAPSSGQILAGNAGGTAYAPVTVSGSGATISMSSAGAVSISAITGTHDGLTAGDVTRTHAVYASASPPTVDVGIFTIGKTGVDLKNAATTTVFTVPASRTYVCLNAWAVVTAVNTPGAGTETFTIKESGASKTMCGGTASASGTPAVGTYYTETVREAGGPYTVCAAGNNVQVVVAVSQAGSTSVTGTVFVSGFYSA